MLFPVRKEATAPTPPPIRVTSYGAGQITLSGLTPEEIEQLRGMVGGFNWCALTAGRLNCRSRLEPLPAPAEDSVMMPFWRPPAAGEVQYQMFEVQVPRHASPSFNIEALCGYDYSEENYAREAEQLERFGFVCLRSRRDPNDGAYWEKWYLPGVWAAKDLLKERLDRYSTEQQKVDAAIKFLCRTARFGSLNVGWQRAAMVID